MVPSMLICKDTVPSILIYTFNMFGTVNLVKLHNGTHNTSMVPTMLICEDAVLSILIYTFNIFSTVNLVKY